MKKILAKLIIKLLAKLPLNGVRAIGCIVGNLSLRFSKRSAKRLKDNLLITKIATPENVEELAKKTAQAMGMTLTESLLIAWQKQHDYIQKLCKIDHESFKKVQEQLSLGKQILFYTPHIGNFEIAIKYCSVKLPLDLRILYKPNKDLLINQIMLEGRTEHNIIPEPTNRKGVVNLMKHFNSGGDIGILPDNVASGGNGEWIKFFGKYVYATTLSAKIYQQYQPSTFIMKSLRTKDGFSLKFIEFKPVSQDSKGIMQELYKVIEEMILEAPEQYYWSYDRFRNVANAKPKPEED